MRWDEDAQLYLTLLLYLTLVGPLSFQNSKNLTQPKRHALLVDKSYSSLSFLFTASVHPLAA